MEYKEIFRLKEMLEESKIPFEFKELNGGYQIRYPVHDFTCSAIEHDFSYGREEDKLEIMGLLTKKEEKNDSVLGYLTAEEVFKRIKKDYSKKPKEIVLSNDVKFVLNEYKTKDGVNYCLKDESGEILMNIESLQTLGKRVLIMTESFNRKGFEVQLIGK